MSNKVAVYGSLRKGLGNHALLAHVKSFEEGVTEEQFKMYSLGGFPAITEEEGAGVVVEVYDVDDATMRRLDRLEGYPSFYDRKEVTVELSSGGSVKSWIYFMHESPTYNSGIVENNDWYKYLESNSMYN